MITSRPKYEELVALPAYTKMSVPQQFEDANGHVNVRHYFAIACEGLDGFLTDQGILADWPTSGHGVFTAEHHMSYLAELLVATEVSSRIQLVGRSERAVHAAVYILDDSNQRLSFVMEEVFLHINMKSRRTAPWPEDVADVLDRHIAGAADAHSRTRGSTSLRLR